MTEELSGRKFLETLEAKRVGSPEWRQAKKAGERAADWGKWGQMISAPLWEAVALSMDIEPEKMSPAPDFRWGNYPFDDAELEYKKRITIACDHTNEGSLIATRGWGGSKYHNPVKLSIFGAWARSLGWSLPKKFPNAQSLPAPVAQKNTGGRTRTWDWEGAIIVVMAKIFDNDIRPDDRPAMNRAMTEWFSSNHPAGECPNESEIRKRAKKIFDALKTS